MIFDNCSKNAQESDAHVASKGSGSGASFSSQLFVSRLLSLFLWSTPHPSFQGWYSSLQHHIFPTLELVGMFFPDWYEVFSFGGIMMLP